LEGGRKELTAMRQDLDTLKVLQAEVKTLKERNAMPAANPDEAKELDAAFYSSPSEMTKKVLKKTFAEEILPELREMFKAEVSGMRGEISSREQANMFAARAVNEYPALQDTESEFYAETAKEVARLSEKPGLKNDPELISLAAQIVAARKPELAKKAKDEYVSPYMGSHFESGGVSPRKRISKNTGPSADDKRIADEMNSIVKDLGIKIKPEDVAKQKELMRMNPKIRPYLKEE